ncbi:MAG: DsrE/DsrF/DrsH-like family protein [Candidatus Altiarchaeota archaeon]
MSKKKVSLVVFSGDLDKALAAMTIATGSAAMGMQVNVFFTFWGLNVIKKKKPMGKNIIQKMLNMMNYGGSDRIKLSKFNFGGPGTWLIKKMMAKEKIPSSTDLIKTAHEFGAKFYACDTTIALMGLTRDDFIDEVDNIADISGYLDDASESDITLFI